MTSDRDPLIQGPTGEETHSPVGGLSVENSNPVQDFMSLLRKPAQFFQSIPLHPDSLLVAKALVGAAVLATLAKFASSGFHLNSGFEALHNLLHNVRIESNFSNSMALEFFEKMQKHLQQSLAVMGHLSLAFIPVFILIEVITKACSIKLFLPLLSNVPSREVGFKRLLVLLAYPKWLSVFASVPFTGWLVNLVIFIFTLNALRWTFKTHWFKSFIAYIFLDLIINLSLFAMLAVMGVAMSLAS